MILYAAWPMMWIAGIPNSSDTSTFCLALGVRAPRADRDQLSDEAS
jgi:hypothetical protein